MIGLEDRHLLAREIDSAGRAGARLRLACEVAGIDVRTLQRWKAHHGLVTGDARPGASRPLPAHALSPEERAHVLHVGAALCRHAAGAYRANAGRRRRVHRQRIDLLHWLGIKPSYSRPRVSDDNA